MTVPVQVKLIVAFSFGWEAVPCQLLAVSQAPPLGAVVVFHCDRREHDPVLQALDQGPADSGSPSIREATERQGRQIDRTASRETLHGEYPCFQKKVAKRSNDSVAYMRTDVGPSLDGPRGPWRKRSLRDRDRLGPCPARGTCDLLDA